MKDPETQKKQNPKPEKTKNKKTKVKEEKSMLGKEYKKIMIPIDGSEVAEVAFKKAVAIAIRNGGALYLVHVVDDLAFAQWPSHDLIIDQPLFDQAQFLKKATEQARKMMEKYEAWALAKGATEVILEVREGRPREVIAKVLPEELGIDLIVIGATGMSRLERVFIGSVAQYVSVQATCDVLIVRADLGQVNEDSERI